jgi:proteasome lid subunit RPN8/RPN11
MPKSLPAVAPIENGPAFDNLDQAAHEVSRDFGKLPKVEQSAALFQRPDGKFSYSAAVTNSDHDNFGMRVQLPKGTQLAAIVHSHPGHDDLGQYFSSNDIDIANQLKVPSYIRFLRDDSIRKYVPGQTSTQNLRGYGTHVATGDALNLPPQNASAQGAMLANVTPPASGLMAPSIPGGGLLAPK